MTAVRAWEAIARSQVGDAHRRHDRPCEDRSVAVVAGGMGEWSPSGAAPWAYLVVSDGHGSAEHFRADRGAEYAVRALGQAFEILKRDLLDVAPEAEVPRADSLHRRHWRAWAPSHVVSTWRALVHQDLLVDPPADPDGEPGLARLLDHVRERDGYTGLLRMINQLDNFRAHAEARHGDEPVEPTPLPLPEDPGWDAGALGAWQAAAYGATLLGVLIGPEALYWFQLGDGAMIQVVGGEAVELVPPPSDARGNETPSLCGDDAVHAIAVDTVPLVRGHVPSAVVLTSDGLPNSFSEPGGFSEFCEDIARRARAGREHVEERLPDWLDEYSRGGSGDDMTVALAWATETATREEAGPC